MRAPSAKFPTATEPFELVSMDIVGPLPLSNQGNKYLLTFTDMTCYCEAIPIPNQTAETVAREFVHKIITRYGVPKRLLTDQGCNFVSSLLRGVCTLLGVQKLRTTPYHPQCNGMIERLHKTLADMLSHFFSPDGKNWDEIVPFALMAYRSAQHVATGFSPHMLMFGQEMKLPEADDLALKPETDENTQFQFDDLVEKLRKVREIAIRNSESSKERNKKYYDKKSKLKHYKLGDHVYLHDPTVKRGPQKKFGKSWKGPYEVVEVLIIKFLRKREKL